MRPAGIHFLRHDSIHLPQQSGRSLHSLQRHMRIMIPRTDKYRHPAKISFIILRINLIPDQPAGKRCHPTIPRSLPRHKFKGQTGALRKAKKKYLLFRDAGGDNIIHYLSQQIQGRPQPRLVLRRRRQKRIGIPRVARRLRRQQGIVLHRQMIRQRKDVFRRRSATMNHDQCPAGGRQRLPGRNNILCMHIF